MALDDILFDTQTAISEGASQYGFKVDENLRTLTLTPRAEQDAFTLEHTDRLNKIIKELLSLAFDLAYRSRVIAVLDASDKTDINRHKEEKIVRDSLDELTDEEIYRATKITTADGRVLKSREYRGE